MKLTQCFASLGKSANLAKDFWSLSLSEELRAASAALRQPNVVLLFKLFRTIRAANVLEKTLYPPLSVTLPSIMTGAKTLASFRLIALATLGFYLFVKSLVLLDCFQKLQIPIAVVGFNLVLVVNNFRSFKGPLQTFGHFKAVLQNLPVFPTVRVSGCMDNNVPFFSNCHPRMLYG